MNQPQSKERIGSIILILITWLMIMIVIIVTKCGNEDHINPVPTDNAIPADTTQFVDSLHPAQDNGSKKKKHKRESKYNKKKAAQPRPYDPHSHPINNHTPQ